MRILFAFALCFGFLLACDSGKKVETKGAELHEKGHDETARVSGLELNNGQKWKSDSSTDKNVVALQKTLQQFETKESHTLADFHNFSAELQSGINTMVNECKMKGPDHDALHLWLEPLMKNVKDLKQKTNEAEAASLVIEIKERIQVYPQFFAS